MTIIPGGLRLCSILYYIAIYYISILTSVCVTFETRESHLLPHQVMWKSYRISWLDVRFPKILRGNIKNSALYKTELVNWRWPIFPRGCPLSIFGAEELNFRVRYGNGCILFASNTKFNCIYHTIKTTYSIIQVVYGNLVKDSSSLRLVDLKNSFAYWVVR